MSLKILLTAASVLFFRLVGGIEGSSQKVPSAYLQSFGRRAWRLSIELAMKTIRSDSRLTFYSSEIKGDIQTIHLTCFFVILKSYAFDVLENHGRVSLVKFGLLGARHYCA